MVIEKFPDEGKTERENVLDQFRRKKKPEYLEPESILLDGEQDEDEDVEFLRKAFGDAAFDSKSQKFSFSQRLLFFGASIVLGIAMCIFLISSFICSLWGLVGLFKNEKLNRPMLRFWRFFCCTLVLTLGFSIAIFNPSMGFFLLTYYFIIGNEANHSEWVKMFLSSQK